MNIGCPFDSLAAAFSQSTSVLCVHQFRATLWNHKSRMTNTDNNNNNELVTVEEFFALPRFLLKLVGVPSIHLKSDLLTLNINSFFYLSALSVLLFIIINFMFIVFAEFDFYIFSINISVLGYTLIAIVKVSPILLKRRSINSVKERLLDVLPRTYETQAKLRECLADSNRMAIYYIIIMALPASLFVAFPMTECVRGFITIGQCNVDHPYHGWFPFDSQRQGLFQFIMIFEYFAATATAIFLFASDMYALALVAKICTHFDMLQEHFSRMQPHRMNVKQDIEFIGQSVIRHNRILK